MKEEKYLYDTTVYHEKLLLIREELLKEGQKELSKVYDLDPELWLLANTNPIEEKLDNRLLLM